MTDPNDPDREFWDHARTMATASDREVVDAASAGDPIAQAEAEHRDVVDGFRPFAARVARPTESTVNRLLLTIDPAARGKLHAGDRVLVVPDGKYLPLPPRPEPVEVPSTGVDPTPNLLGPSEVPRVPRGHSEPAVDPGGRMGADHEFAPFADLDVAGLSAPYIGPSGWSDFPWKDASVIVARLVLVAVLVAACSFGAYLVGRARGEHAIDTRTRTAVCQVLDQLGADPATAAQAAPCKDTPAP